MLIEIKDAIKLRLFFLNRLYSFFYFRFFSLLNYNNFKNRIRVLFVIDDLDNNRSISTTLRIFLETIERIENVWILKSSQFPNDLDRLIENISSLREKVDYIWLDVGTSVPTLFAIKYLNELEHIKGEIIVFDSYVKGEGKPYLRTSFSEELFLHIDYLQGAVFFPIEEFSEKPEFENTNLFNLYLYLVMKHFIGRKSFRNLFKIGFITSEPPIVNKDYQIRIQKLFKYFPHSEKIDYHTDKRFFTYKLKNPFISIIIPFRDKVELLKVIVDSIYEKSSYEDFELLLVSNQSVESITFSYLTRVKSEHQNVKILDYNNIFNFSAINNFAVSQASGDALFFLNNDTKVITENFLEVLASFAMHPSIGSVGPKLLYEDGKIQHAGVILGLSGMAEHAFKDLENIDIFDSLGSPFWIRNCLAVTAAALMIEKKKFEAVGGFDEKLVVCGNDVNLCLKLYEKGFRNVYVPQVELFHYESKSRTNTAISIKDYRESLSSYLKYLENGDPYFHPQVNLTLPWFTYNFSNIPSYVKSLRRLKNQMPEIFKDSES